MVTTGTYGDICHRQSGADHRGNICLKKCVHGACTHLSPTSPSQRGLVGATSSQPGDLRLCLSSTRCSLASMPCHNDELLSSPSTRVGKSCTTTLLGHRHLGHRWSPRPPPLHSGLFDCLLSTIIYFTTLIGHGSSLSMEETPHHPPRPCSWQ